MTECEPRPEQNPQDNISNEHPFLAKIRSIKEEVFQRIQLIARNENLQNVAIFTPIAASFSSGAFFSVRPFIGSGGTMAEFGLGIILLGTSAFLGSVFYGQFTTERKLNEFDRARQHNLGNTSINQ